MTSPTLLATMRRVPPLQAMMRRRYERRFRTARGAGALAGLYASFDDAAAAVPVGAPRGYDHPAAGELYRDLHDDVQAKDYPALFWLRPAVVDGAIVFDLGGHVGVSYYAYRRYLALPATLRWRVCDTPAVVAQARALAATRGATALEFTTDRRAMTDADVLLASGVLQYLDEPLDVMLERANARPRHIVVNQMPTHPVRALVTLQNIGVAYCPYRVAPVQEVPTALERLGYELVDRWHDPSRRTAVPYHAESAPIDYTGYYLRRRDLLR